MKRAIGWGVMLGLVALVVGCGSGGNTPSAGSSDRHPVGGQTMQLNGLEVRAATGLKTVSLEPGEYSEAVLTALYGSKITRARSLGLGRIAFASNRDVATAEIYTMNPDGSDVRRLTNNGAADTDPSWSPDGSQIAFQSYRDGDWEIFKMNADGTGQTQLTANVAAIDDEPAWSPRGNKIAFQSHRDGNPEIYVMNTDGTGQTRLTNTPDVEEFPQWSPDGRRIIYDRGPGGPALTNDVWVMNADGTGQNSLSQTANDWEVTPAWSPDGRFIAFAGGKDGNDEIYYTRADFNGTPNAWNRVTSNPAVDTQPTWSADSRNLVFTSFRDGDHDLYRVPLFTGWSTARNLTANGKDDQDPDWSSVPTVARTFIGAGTTTDGGSAAPFGTARPLLVVGNNAEGVVSATTVDVPTASWSTVAAAALRASTMVTGLKVTAASITGVTEDVGRGLRVRTWTVNSSPIVGTFVGAVLVFFSTETGKVTSVLATTDTALGRESAAQLTARGIVLRGRFTTVLSAKDPRRNLASTAARQVVLNARTGEVASVE